MEIKNQSHNILKGYNLLLYFAGSMIMYEPNEECVVDFWQQGIIRRLPVSSTNPRFALATSQLMESCVDKAQCLIDLKNDFKSLFMNDDGQPLAPAYESLYNPDKLSPAKIMVSEFYSSYGWKSRHRGKVSDDHLGVEILFLTILVDKYLYMDDQVCLVEIRSEIRRFIENHLFPWIGEWNTRMQQRAATLCYRGIATLIIACVEDIYALCDNNPVSAVRPEYLRN